MNAWKTASLLLGALLFSLINPIQVWAQGEIDGGDDGGGEPGPGWAEILDADGAILLDQLNYVGSVTSEPEWMAIQIGGGIDIQLEAHFEQYITPSGQVLMLPSPGTVLMMANSLSNPDSDYVTQSLGTYTNSWFLGTQISATDTASGSVAELVSTGVRSGDFEFFSQPDQFYEYIGSGGSDAASWTTLEAFTSLMTLSWQNQFPVIAMLLFESCAAVPEGCTAIGEALVKERNQALPSTAGSGDGGDPANSPLQLEDCPPARLESQPIQIGSQAPQGSGGKLAPALPVVVGQDPEQRGVDIQVQVTVPPVIYTWYEAVPVIEWACVPALNAAGAGCPGPAGRYADDDWHPSRVQNSAWREVLQFSVDCIQHVEVYSDPIAEVGIRLSLSAESRAYITGHLAEVYPGLRLHQPDFSFSLPGPGSLREHHIIWQQVLQQIPVADPGLWQVSVTAQTSGTPVSPGRVSSAGLGAFTVDSIRVSLVQP